MKIYIEKTKQEAVHSELMEVMCIATALRDKIHLVKDSEELKYDDWPDILDAMQTELNEFKAKISEMIGNLMITAVDKIMDPDNKIRLHCQDEQHLEISNKEDKIYRDRILYIKLITIYNYGI